MVVGVMAEARVVAERAGVKVAEAMAEARAEEGLEVATAVEG